MLVALRRTIEDSCDVVGQVTTGGAVLDAVLRLRPELIVLDLSLPEINGLDLCCQIKDASPATVVVFVTAIDDEEIKAEALHLGAAALVQKSAIATDLVATIEMAVARARAGQPNAWTAEQPGSRTAELSSSRTTEQPDRHRGPA